MSEIKAEYKGQVIPLTLEAFKNRSCSLGIEHSEFIPPTPEEVKSLRTILRFTQNDLARFVGVSYSKNKGSSTVKKWETASKKESRAISLSAWQLMLIKAGLVVVTPII